LPAGALHRDDEPAFAAETVASSTRLLRAPRCKRRTAVVCFTRRSIRHSVRLQGGAKIPTGGMSAKAGEPASARTVVA